jgi:nucleotide-binding universal stress UspA family protein
MFKNIIVPLDGSREATAALPVARTLAAVAGARISLRRVVHRPACLFASHANEVREAAAYLDAVAGDELGTVGLPVSTHVRSGDVVDAILEDIDEGGSGVVVMATRGHAGVVRAVLGSVASELIAKSPVPVVLLRAGTRPVDRIRQILVPIDGSPETEQALTTVVGFARLTGAHVTLLQVVTPAPIPTWAGDLAGISAPGLYVGSSTHDVVAETRQYVNACASRLSTQGISVDALAIIGEVPETITQSADALNADLIVMSTHGHTGAARAVLGSVADAVVRTASMPVMLLRERQDAGRTVATTQPHSLDAVPSA